MTNRSRAFWATTALLTTLAASAAYAQETTGGITGQVLDASGSPLSGATVQVLHVPSGTSTTALTDASGFYSTRNLRVGGPYIITATLGGETARADISAIGIGSPADVDVFFAGSDAGSAVDDIVVTGARGALRTSPATNYGLSDIETLPSITRDIKDFVRTSPFATVDPSNVNALSIGGQNTRYNAFLVDGVRQGDDFGLNAGG